MADDLTHAISQISLGVSDPPRNLSQQARSLSLRIAEHSVLVQRLHRSQPLCGLREFVVRQWKLDGLNSAVIQSDGIIQAFFDSHDHITTVFENEPWIFRGWPIAIDLPTNSHTPHFLKEFSVWIRVTNIPPPFRSHLTLMDIGGFLGTPEDSELEHSTTVVASDP